MRNLFEENEICSLSFYVKTNENPIISKDSLLELGSQQAFYNKKVWSSK